MIGAHVVVAFARSEGDHNMLLLEIIFTAILALLFVFASYLGAWLSRRLHRDSGGSEGSTTK